MIEEARNERARAKHAQWQAERKAEAEAAEAARVARIKWEIDHGEEARKAYYAEALAEAKERDGGDFDQVAFDARYEPGEGGYVGFDNPQREFSCDGAKSITRFGRATWKPSRTIRPSTKITSKEIGAWPA